MTAFAAGPLLKVRDLALRVRDRTLVQALSFAVDRGELWCLLGPNGSGKTTLLHTLAGLRGPQDGDVRVGGRGYGQWSPLDAARRRGLLPQALHDAFSAPALDVVLMGRHPHLSRWSWEGDHDRAVARAALAAVDLAGLEDRDVLQLSGGERQRVGIAAVLAQQPELMLLDEPVAHLDLHHQLRVLEHLRRLTDSGRAAIVLSIHDLNLARRFATHALVLDGRGGAWGGLVDDVMDASTLSTAFGHPVERVQAGARTLFVAG